MSKEILLKSEEDEKGTVITVSEKDAPSPEEERDGRYGVTAYVKTENNNTTQHSPTFFIKALQRCPAKCWAKNGKVFGASLVNDHAGVGISVPPEGGTFDLVQGYWRLTVTGTYYRPGGIFASVTYQ